MTAANDALYNTEKWGVRALGERLAEKFDLDVEFVDVPNPVLKPLANGNRNLAKFGYLSSGVRKLACAEKLKQASALRHKSINNNTNR